MLTYFSAENFLSINEKIELDLSISSKENNNFSANNIATAAAIYGANASGKSNILKAISCLSQLAYQSQNRLMHDNELPFKTWFNDENPSVLSCKILDKKKKIIFYEISFNHQEILTEKLTHADKEIYKRNQKKITTSTDLETKLPFSSLRRNASFLSFAMSFNQLKEIGETFYFHFKIAKEPLLYLRFRDREEIQEDFNLISGLDTGLVSLHFEEKQTQAPSLGRSISSLEIFGDHDLPNGTIGSLPFHEESLGTQSALVLAGYVRQALEKGRVLLVDELEENLHPHVVKHFLELFQSKETNPRNAQIIFTTHLPEIMNRLNPYNIFLTEKRKQATDLWRLDDIENLNYSESFKERYLQGAYDGVPHIGSSG